MALNTLKCNHLTPLGLKGLIEANSCEGYRWCVVTFVDIRCIRFSFVFSVTSVWMNVQMVRRVTRK